jgi:site-specific DNA recombinase
MLCALYARKSTEQDVSDDAKSVSRQLALARAFADEKGWTIAEEYVDDGISGALASKLVNRARLLAAAAEGKFSAVIVRDYDRLSRDDREGPASSTPSRTAAWRSGTTPTGAASTRARH